MKRLFTFLFALILLQTLTACDNKVNTLPEHASSSNSQVTKVQQPDSNQILNDLRNSLDEYQENKNSYKVTLSEYQIEKSLTDESSYSAKIKVSAESQYARLFYTAEIAYTLYDQGWFMDTCQWDISNYEVIVYPTKDDVPYLPESDLANQLENCKFEGVNSLFMVTGTLTNSWSSYAAGTEYVTLTWEYDVLSDRWEYQNIMQNDIDYTLTSEFESAWSNQSSRVTGFGQVSDVTNTGFDFCIDDPLVKTESYHVELSSVSTEQDSLKLTFTNNDIEFYLKEEKCTQKGKLQIIVTLPKQPEVVDNEYWGCFTYDMLIDYAIGNKGGRGYSIYSGADFHTI